MKNQPTGRAGWPTDRPNLRTCGATSDGASQRADVRAGGLAGGRASKTKKMRGAIRAKTCARQPPHHFLGPVREKTLSFPNRSVVPRAHESML